MTIQEILRTVDHTLLSQTATWDDINALCEEGLEYGVASVCIPPCYVKQAAQLLGDKLPVCTVIGFPNGYSTTQAKIFEADEAVRDGAAEIDMVINIGALKAGRYREIADEIRDIKVAVGSRVLKVIIETCLLTDDEKIKMCELVSEAGADFIKTSTGFSKSGATLADITLFKSHVKNGVRIKAAGGIQTINDAVEFIEAGADRLGTSRIVKLIRGGSATGY